MGIGYILALLLGGLIIGALARLLVPGPNPMGILATILLGIAGSFAGGILGQFLFGRPGGFLLALAAAVVILLIYERTRRRTT